MYNLHSHSILSDGCLLPSEIAVRYWDKGYKVIAITDHVDYSNIKATVSAIVEFCRHWPKSMPIKVLPGVELTHLPLEQFKPLARFARQQGAKVIVGHGETIAEPVIKGSNRAALEADIDILAHPGLISEADVLLAKKRNVFLELTSRKGHCATNRHVAEMAREFGARLILNHDSHEPEDIISIKDLAKVGLNAGLTSKELERVLQETGKFLKNIGK